MSETEKQTEEWYRQYYAKHGADRNHPLNPEVVLQANAAHLSLVMALQSLRLDMTNAKILDVGCGNGASLITPLGLGFAASNLFGIDILQDRIDEAVKRLPSANLACGDASKMPYEGATFDVVMASTMFVQLTDNALASKIAQEMIRVTKPQGHLIIVDWRYNKPGDSTYLAVNKKRLNDLFTQNGTAQLDKAFSGALVPPIGRRLSKRNWIGCYYTLQRLLPFLVGQKATVIKKL